MFKESLTLLNTDFFKNIRLVFQLRNIIPDCSILTINELPAMLKTLNVNAVIFDADQTIIKYGRNNINTEILTIIQTISSHYKCCILSNFPRSDFFVNRLEEIKYQSKLEVISPTYKKPDASAFMAALRYLRTTPKQTVMVGDRIMTDILGANSLGINTILLPPLDWRTDPLIMVTIPRIIEQIFFKLINIFIRKKLESGGKID